METVKLTHRQMSAKLGLHFDAETRARVLRGEVSFEADGREYWTDRATIPSSPATAPSAQRDVYDEMCDALGFPPEPGAAASPTSSAGEKDLGDRVADAMGLPQLREAGGR